MLQEGINIVLYGVEFRKIGQKILSEKKTGLQALIVVGACQDHTIFQMLMEFENHASQPTSLDCPGPPGYNGYAASLA